VCLNDAKRANVRELPIMCAVTDFCSLDYDVILPAAVVCNLQAEGVVSKGLCNGPTVRTCCKEQPGANSTTADRLSSGTKVGVAVGSKPRLRRTDRQPKRNLGYGMVHEAYSVVMCYILCVALIVCVALMSAIDNCDIMFARVLTPAPVVVSCLSLSHRSFSSQQADLMMQRQPDPQQELRQLLDEFANLFDGRSRRCNARIFRRQATDGLVRRRMRPCCAPDLCFASRSIRPSNSLMAGPIVCVAKKDGGVRIACRYRCLNSFTVGDVSLIPTIDEGLRDIVKGHVM